MKTFTIYEKAYRLIQAFLAKYADERGNIIINGKHIVYEEDVFYVYKGEDSGELLLQYDVSIDQFEDRTEAHVISDFIHNSLLRDYGHGTDDDEEDIDFAMTESMVKWLTDIGISNRIDKMVEGWQTEGRAFSSLRNMTNDGEFFHIIGISSDKVGITSQTGNDIVYYNTQTFANDKDAIHNRPIKKVTIPLGLLKDIDVAFEMVRISWDAPTPQATNAINAAWEQIRTIIKNSK